MSVFSLRATGAEATLDLHEVRRGILLLPDPNHGCEIRGLPSGRSQVRRGSDVEGLIRAVESVADDRGVYYCLNPIPAELDHPARVGDVLSRRWLLIDVDAGQPVDQSSTQAEKDNASLLGEKIREDLSAQGWPAPVVVDSGNGWHLLYRIDLPSTPEVQTILRTFLKALAERYAAFAPAKVDTAVHNAARIAKMPGTWARKGANTPERPHRMAWIAYAPEHPGIVPASMIEAASTARAPEPALPENVSRLFLRASEGHGRAYARKALENECAAVCMAPVGQRNNTLNKAAFSLGQLVAAGAILEGEVRSELVFAAVRVGLGEDEASKTVRSGLEAGKEKPRAIPESPRNGFHKPDKQLEHEVWTVEFDGEIAVEAPALEFPQLYAFQSASGRRRTFGVRTLKQLLAAEFPDPCWAVPGLLAEGLNLLAGSPKSGKSMLALNLALTVAGGGLALGNIRTVPGGVLYLSLEDMERRVQSRARKMGALIGRGTPERLSVATHWPRMDQGGLGLLSEWVKRADSPRLLIVDVLGKFRPMLRDRGNAYEQDSQHMYAIKEFADENHLTVLVLHHTRKLVGKEKERDEFEDVSGTQGLAGGCDGILMLKRARQSNEATVAMTGRDSGEQKLALQFDPETLTWSSLGTAEEHLQGVFQVKLLNYMKSRPGLPIFPSELADALSADGGAVRKTLHRLNEKGIVCRKGQAWTYPAGPAGGDEEFL